MIMLNNNLRIFITVAEMESITEAAKKLYISQPAVSQAIRKLEEELGVKLFIRNKRSSLMLTDIGHKTLAVAYQMADLENKMYQAAYEENHLMGGTVRIATVPTGASIILSRVLPIFKKQFPEVTVELIEAAPAVVTEMVRTFQADLGIGTPPYQDMEHLLLLKDKMVSISRDEPRRVDLKTAGPDLVLCRVAYESITELLTGQDIDLSHSLVVDAASTQLNMVASGNGHGVISQLMLSTIPNELVCGTVVPKMDMEISLLTHHFDDLPTAAKEMANMILQYKQI